MWGRRYHASRPSPPVMARSPDRAMLSTGGLQITEDRLASLGDLRAGTVARSGDRATTGGRQAGKPAPRRDVSASG